NDTVEVGRITLGHQHAFTAACGAAGEVRMIGGPRVVRRDDLLCETGHAADGLIREVERRLLLAHEVRIEPIRARMSGFGADDCEAANQSGCRAGCRRPERECYAAVQPTAALLKESAVPRVRHRDREADAVWLAVTAGASIDHPVDAA